MSAGSADGPPAAGCFGGARGGASRGGAPAVGCFGPERAPLLDGTRSARRAETSAGRPRLSAGYRSREDTVTEDDDPEYGILLETAHEPRGALSDGDPAETRGGVGLDRASDPEIRPSAIRPALVMVAVAAAPFGVGLALGYPRAAAPTLLCAETFESAFESAGHACVTHARAARLDHLLLAGAAAGALLAGGVADAVGRRGALRLSGAVSAAGWVAGELVFGAATRGGALGRALVGVGSGAATTASVLLAAETAAPATRALALALTQLALALGLALMHLLALAERPRWRWRQLALFAAAVNASLAFGGATVGKRTRFLFGALPESPRWLARRGREPSRVVRAIAHARGLSETDPRVAEETAGITRDAVLCERNGGANAFSFAASTSRLLTRGNRSRALFKVTGLVAVATLGGLSLPSRHASVALVSGFDDAPTAAFAHSAAKTLGATACAAAAASPGGPGRRVAFLISVCGMLAANVAVVASLVLAPPSSETENEENNTAGNVGDAVRALAPPFFALAHAAGAATAPWLVAAEAFPFPARGAAMGLVAAAHWTYLLDAQFWVGAAAGNTVSGTAAQMGVAAFGAFGVVCAAGLSLVAPRGQTLVPEAEGRDARERAGSRGSADGKRTIGIARGF